MSGEGGMARRNAVILGCLATANLFAYAARNGLFTVYPDLRERFGIHDAKLGLLATAFLVPHAIATLPFGWAGDRYDRRRVIAAGLLLASVAGAAGALATDVTTLVLSRVVLGFGLAAVVPVANSIIGQLYDGPRKASRMAIFNLGLLLGGVAGFGVGLAVGFPAVVVVLAIPGAVIAIVIAFLPVPPHPARALRSTDPRASLAGDFNGLLRRFIQSSLALLRVRTLRWVMVSTTAMAFAAGGYNAWLIDFLERDKGMSKGSATTLLSIAGVGALAGVLTGGRLADRLRVQMTTGRLWTIAIGMACTAPCAMLCIVVAPGPLLYVGGVATMFFISWYHAPMAVSVDDLAPASHAVAAQGLVIFTMHLLGTAPSSYVLGIVSEHSSLYTAMWVPTGALLIAAIAMIVATRSFAGDSRAARSGGGAVASL